MKLHFKWVFLFFIILVPGSFLFFAWRLGMFSTLSKVSLTWEPYTIVGEIVMGKYETLPPKVGKWKEKISNCRFAYVYLSDPTKSIDKFRKAIVGCYFKKPPSNAKLDQVFQIKPGPGKEFRIRSHPVFAFRQAFNAIDRENYSPVLQLTDGYLQRFYQAEHATKIKFPKNISQP